MITQHQPMFSVLLPTKDRLELLQEAISTVTRQKFQSWQIVVSDNASKSDIKSYVDSLSDKRIKYIRSDEPLSVTENWNKATEAADGEWIVMLGDDDGLTPNYFERMFSYINQLDKPDLIYHGAYHLAFPNVLTSYPNGALIDVTVMQPIFDNRYMPCMLPKDEAEKIVRAALDMRLSFSFNMQYFLFRRTFLMRLKEYGPVFQGPYPDFYLSNLSFLKAEKIGLLPFPMTIIGISPKSYGYFHFNNDEKGGISFLANVEYAKYANTELKNALLPGNEMNSQWLVSVAKVSHHLPEKNLKLGIKRYRLLQVISYMFRPRPSKTSALRSLIEMSPMLSLIEKIQCVLIAIVAVIAWPMIRLFKRDQYDFFLKLAGQYKSRKKFFLQLIVFITAKILFRETTLLWQHKLLDNKVKSVTDAYLKISQLNGNVDE